MSERIPPATSEAVERHNFHFNAPLQTFRTLRYKAKGEWRAYPTTPHADLLKGSIENAFGAGATEVRVYNSLTGELMEVRRGRL